MFPTTPSSALLTAEAILRAPSLVPARWLSPASSAGTAASTAPRVSWPVVPRMFPSGPITSLPSWLLTRSTIFIRPPLGRLGDGGEVCPIAEIFPRVLRDDDDAPTRGSDQSE